LSGTKASPGKPWPPTDGCLGVSPNSKNVPGCCCTWAASGPVLGSQRDQTSPGCRLGANAVAARRTRLSGSTSKRFRWPRFALDEITCGWSPISFSPRDRQGFSDLIRLAGGRGFGAGRARDGYCSPGSARPHPLPSPTLAETFGSAGALRGGGRGGVPNSAGKRGTCDPGATRAWPGRAGRPVFPRGFPQCVRGLGPSCRSLLDLLVNTT